MPERARMRGVEGIFILFDSWHWAVGVVEGIGYTYVVRGGGKRACSCL